MQILVTLGSCVFRCRGGGRISGFSIDCQRRPYNTLALTCQRVIRFDLNRIRLQIEFEVDCLKENDLNQIGDKPIGLQTQFDLFMEGVRCLHLATSDF